MRLGDESGPRGSRRRLALILVLSTVVALGTGGCGGSEEVDTEIVTDSIVDPGDLPETVIDDDDRSEYEDGSVEVAFLDYWEALQFGDISEALDFYDPEFLNAVGRENVAAGLRLGSSLYRGRKPGIVETTSSGDGIETIRYLLQDLSGTRTPYSISWRRVDDEWKIVFNGYLGDSIKSVVQAREQARIDPAAQTPLPQAERAANAAAARQDDFYDGLVTGN